MSLIKVLGRELDVDLFVFDKDGLLFESKPFWIELAYSRAKALEKYLNKEQIMQWLKLMSVKFEETKFGYLIKDIDEKGIISVASPSEEIVITASFLVMCNGFSWTRARDTAKSVFKKSDESFDLKKALIPKKGFPGIFKRLQNAGIPYGIATSDDYNRAKMSVNLFDDFEKVCFTITPLDVKNGKPNPEMLMLAERKTKIPVSKMVMVGDSYVDVLMAKEAGAIGIGVPNTKEMSESMKEYTSLIIESLDDIVI